MSKELRIKCRALALALGVGAGLGCLSFSALALASERAIEERRAESREAASMVAKATAMRPESSKALAVLDRSGGAQRGQASFYAAKYFGRKMADGTIMSPEADNAASQTLPLGTRARVTNLATGRSGLVTVRDRGPYVKGRIIDLSPATARTIGLESKAGLTDVVVEPISIPAAGRPRKAGGMSARSIGEARVETRSPWLSDSG